MKLNSLLAITALGGLTLLAGSAFAQTWTQTSAPITNWSSVASSADGAKLVAAANPGLIYTSPDSGTTWTPTSAPNTNWVSVASSADGMKLAAVVYQGPVYTSTNSGTNWTLSRAPDTNALDYSGSVASSADGTRLVAGGFPLYLSTDSGATWTASSAPGGSWSPVACSADGNTLAGLHFYGELIVSTNAGATWRTTNINNGWWTSAALSADGRSIVAVCRRRIFQGNFYPGEIYTSSNSGATWNLTSAPGNSWSSVASSADGTRLVTSSGSICTSMDTGATWTSNSVPGMNWSSVASSADGGRLVAVVNDGGIWTAQFTVAPLLLIRPSASNLVLSWTVPSLPFVLQENSDLSTTNWTDVPGTPELNFTNLQHQMTLPLPAGNRFYRLKY